MEYYNRILVIIKDEILPFATAWMDLEIIILNEIKSDREKQVSCDITYIGIQKKKSDTSKLMYKTETES